MLVIGNRVLSNLKVDLKKTFKRVVKLLKFRFAEICTVSNGDGDPNEILQ